MSLHEEMEGRPRRIDLSGRRNLRRSNRLWCGKVQGLCDGTVCITCHLFPGGGGLHTERGSLISSSSMTDHGFIGLTAEIEEE